MRRTNGWIQREDINTCTPPKQIKGSVDRLDSSWDDCSDAPQQLRAHKLCGNDAADAMTTYLCVNESDRRQNISPASFLACDFNLILFFLIESGIT